MTDDDAQNAVLDVIGGQAGLSASEIAHRARLRQADAIKVIRKLYSITQIEECAIGSGTYRVPLPMQGSNRGARRQ